MSKIKNIIFYILIGLNSLSVTAQSILLLSPKEFKNVQNKISTPKRLWPDMENDFSLPYCDSAYVYPDNLLRDIVKYNDEKIAIEYSPLLSFSGIENVLIRADESKTKVLSSIGTPVIDFYPTCARRYIATWIIKDKKIYLSDIKQHINTKNSNKKVSGKEIKKRVENYTKRYFEDGLLFADWINGTIIGGANGFYLGKQIYVYTKEYHIQVKNGEIIDIQIKTRKDPVE